MGKYYSIVFPPLILPPLLGLASIDIIFKSKLRGPSLTGGQGNPFSVGEIPGRATPKGNRISSGAPGLLGRSRIRGGADR